ncbi:hypothetical protein MTO96_023739 [Rhipicephalus appendiculatus]
MRADTTFDEFFEDFMDGYVPFGHYFEHVLSWYARRNDPNVFFFYYENFKSDPKKTGAGIGEVRRRFHLAKVTQR